MGYNGDITVISPGIMVQYKVVPLVISSSFNPPKYANFRIQQMEVLHHIKIICWWGYSNKNMVSISKNIGLKYD